VVTRAYAVTSRDWGDTGLTQSSANWREDYREPLQPTTDRLTLLCYYWRGAAWGTVSNPAALMEGLESRGMFDAAASWTATKGLPIRDLGWSREEALETRMRLRAFEEDWDAPGMDVYDEL